MIRLFGNGMPVEGQTVNEFKAEVRGVYISVRELNGNVLVFYGVKEEKSWFENWLDRVFGD